MKRSMIPLCAAVTLGLAGCGNQSSQGSASGTMEGGGAYPTGEPTPVDTLSTDPAAAATQNEAENMAPSSLNSAPAPQGQPTNPASPTPTRAAP